MAFNEYIRRAIKAAMNNPDLAPDIQARYKKMWARQEKYKTKEDAIKFAGEAYGNALDQQIMEQAVVQVAESLGYKKNQLEKFIADRGIDPDTMTPGRPKKPGFNAGNETGATYGTDNVPDVKAAEKAYNRGAGRPSGNSSEEAIRDLQKGTPAPQTEPGPLDGVTASPSVDKPPVDAPVPGTVPNPEEAPPSNVPMRDPKKGPVRLIAGDASGFELEPPAQASPGMTVKVDYRPALLNDNSTQQKIVLNTIEQPVGSVGRGDMQPATLDGELFLPRQKKDLTQLQPMALFVTFDNDGKMSGRYMFDITQKEGAELVPIDDAMHRRIASTVEEDPVSNRKDVINIQANSMKLRQEALDQDVTSPEWMDMMFASKQRWASQTSVPGFEGADKMVADRQPKAPVTLRDYAEQGVPLEKLESGYEAQSTLIPDQTIPFAAGDDKPYSLNEGITTGVRGHSKSQLPGVGGIPAPSQEQFDAALNDLAQFFYQRNNQDDELARKIIENQGQYNELQGELRGIASSVDPYTYAGQQNAQIPVGFGQAVDDNLFQYGFGQSADNRPGGLNNTRSTLETGIHNETSKVPMTSLYNDDYMELAEIDEQLAAYANVPGYQNTVGYRDLINRQEKLLDKYATWYGKDSLDAMRFSSDDGIGRLRPNEKILDLIQSELRGVSTMSEFEDLMNRYRTRLKGEQRQGQLLYPDKTPIEGGGYQTLTPAGREADEVLRYLEGSANDTLKNLFVDQFEGIRGHQSQVLDELVKDSNDLIDAGMQPPEWMVTAIDEQRKNLNEYLVEAQKQYDLGGASPLGDQSKMFDLITDIKYRLQTLDGLEDKIINSDLAPFMSRPEDLKFPVNAQGVAQRALAGMSGEERAAAIERLNASLNEASYIPRVNQSIPENVPGSNADVPQATNSGMGTVDLGDIQIRSPEQRNISGDTQFGFTAEPTREQRIKALQRKSGVPENMLSESLMDAEDPDMLERLAYGDPGETGYGVNERTYETAAKAGLTGSERNSRLVKALMKEFTSRGMQPPLWMRPSSANSRKINFGASRDFIKQVEEAEEIANKSTKTVNITDAAGNNQYIDQIFNEGTTLEKIEEVRATEEVPKTPAEMAADRRKADVLKARLDNMREQGTAAETMYKDAVENQTSIYSLDKNFFTGRWDGVEDDTQRIVWQKLVGGDVLNDEFAFLGVPGSESRNQALADFIFANYIKVKDGGSTELSQQYLSLVDKELSIKQRIAKHKDDMQAVNLAGYNQDYNLVRGSRGEDIVQTIDPTTGQPVKGKSKAPNSVYASAINASKAEIAKLEQELREVQNIKVNFRETSQLNNDYAGVSQKIQEFSAGDAKSVGSPDTSVRRPYDEVLGLIDNDQSVALQSGNLEAARQLETSKASLKNELVALWDDVEYGDSGEKLRQRLRFIIGSDVYQRLSPEVRAALDDNINQAVSYIDRGNAAAESIARAEEGFQSGAGAPGMNAKDARVDSSRSMPGAARSVLPDGTVSDLPRYEVDPSRFRTSDIGEKLVFGQDKLAAVKQLTDGTADRSVLDAMFGEGNMASLGRMDARELVQERNRILDQMPDSVGKRGYDSTAVRDPEGYSLETDTATPDDRVVFDDDTTQRTGTGVEGGAEETFLNRAQRRLHEIEKELASITPRTEITQQAPDGTIQKAATFDQESRSGFTISPEEMMERRRVLEIEQKQIQDNMKALSEVERVLEYRSSGGDPVDFTKVNSDYTVKVAYDDHDVPHLYAQVTYTRDYDALGIDDPAINHDMSGTVTKTYAIPIDSNAAPSDNRPFVTIDLTADNPQPDPHAFYYPEGLNGEAIDVTMESVDTPAMQGPPVSIEKTIGDNNEAQARLNEMAPMAQAQQALKTATTPEALEEANKNIETTKSLLKNLAGPGTLEKQTDSLEAGRSAVIDSVLDQGQPTGPKAKKFNTGSTFPPAAEGAEAIIRNSEDNSVSVDPTITNTQADQGVTGQVGLDQEGKPISDSKPVDTPTAHQVRELKQSVQEETGGWTGGKIAAAALAASGATAGAGAVGKYMYDQLQVDDPVPQIEEPEYEKRWDGWDEVKKTEPTKPTKKWDKF